MEGSAWLTRLSAGTRLDTRATLDTLTYGHETIIHRLVTNHPLYRRPFSLSTPDSNLLGRPAKARRGSSVFAHASGR
jgi:hypothetical protein